MPQFRRDVDDPTGLRHRGGLALLDELVACLLNLDVKADQP